MRRVLVIAYYFPPSGGSGVQRALKFVKYLQEFGWQPTVLTVHPKSAAYPDLDEGMMSDVPSNVEVHRTGSWDPYRIYAGLSLKSKEAAVSVGFLSDKPMTIREKVARWIRANVFIPDARVGWYFYALRKAKSIIENEEIEAVFTTGPPHSTHIIGRTLKRKYGLPWVADFRDPWVDIDFLAELPMSNFAKRRNALLEQSVLDEASQILTVSPAMQRNFAAKTITRCTTIYNGFDVADFNAADVDKVVAGKPDAFIISHVGNMNAARNPEALWQVLATGRREGLFLNTIIRLVGNVDGLVMQRLSALELDGLVDSVEYCPHHEAVEYMKSSDVLLLPINNVASARGIVTGKLFEYLATGRPILGIGPEDGDAAQILTETEAGEMFAHTNQEGLDIYLRRLYDNWSNGSQETVPNVAKRAKYSRKGLTKQLAEVLEGLAQGINQ